MKKSLECRRTKLSFLSLLAVMALLSASSSPSVSASEAPFPLPDRSSSSLRTPRTLQEAGISTNEIISQAPEPPATPEPTSPSTPATITTPYAPIPVRGGASFTSGPGIGYESSFLGMDGFFPISQTPGQNLTYVQGRLLLDTNGGNPGGNVTVGYRDFDPSSGRILGGYVGVDLRDTGNKTFSQLGAGVEAVFSGIEFRVNGYLPLGDRRREVDSQSFTSTSISGGSGTTTATNIRFQGNSLFFDLPAASTLTTTRFTRALDEVALGGFDVEAGVKLAQLAPGSDLRSYLGLYYYSGEGVSGFVGVRGRLALRVNDAFTTGLSVQSDREFGTTAVATINLQFPKGGRKPSGQPGDNWARMGDSTIRNQAVAVTQRDRTTTTKTVQTVGSGSGGTVVAQNPATGQPWVFQHAVLGAAGGNGTFESPFGTVAAALTAAPGGTGNDIVYVQAGPNPGIPAFTLKDGVQVLSSGVVQTLATVQGGTVNLPLSGSGTLPTVTGTVTMGNNSTLAGFNVTPPSNNSGIVANRVQNVTVRQNQVSVSSNPFNPGIELENVTGTATVTGNTVETVGSSFGQVPGINVRLNATTLAQLTLTGNNITTSGNSSDGIWVNPVFNSTITTATVTGNTITTGGIFSYGILVNPVSNSTITTATVTGNTITTNGFSSYGVFVNPAFDSTITTATLTDNTITTNWANSDGILVQPQDRAIISALTLTNNTIPRAGRDSVRIENQGGQPLCVAMTGNRSQNPNVAAGGVDFNLFPGGQPFRVINLPTVSANNVSGTFRYNGAVAPAAPFANVTTCP